MKILVINGPNLNLLGIREKNIYGNSSYKDLKQYLKTIAKQEKTKIKILQSNSEGKIVDCIHYALKKKYDGIVINPGAYTHYSYAIFDAIKAVNINTVEVHLSDITKREDFRRNSVISSACIKTIMGKHFKGYKEAIKYLISTTR